MRKYSSLLIENLMIENPRIQWPYRRGLEMTGKEEREGQDVNNPSFTYRLRLPSK